MDAIQKNWLSGYLLYCPVFRPTIYPTREKLVTLCTQNCFGLIGLWRNACPLRGGSLKSSYYNWPVARPIRLRDGPVVLLRNHGSPFTAQFLKIFDRYGSTFFVYFLCPESSSLMELE